MRQLASIQIISDIKDIPNANVIKVASILGWKTVIKEGQFKIGDKCVFVEIDAIFPDKPEFAEFLKKGRRVKTIRLRGQISQGVCLPLHILPNDKEYNVGDDVTEILGITKYEPPMPASLGGEVKGLFPSFIPKTDETRIQVLQHLLDKYQGQRFFVTEKLDGTSATYYIKDGKFGVCGRTLEYKETEGNTYWKMARKYNIEERLTRLSINIAIQGEIIGEGIQGNPYKIRGQELYIFNTFDIDTFSYLLHCSREAVPFLGVINLPNNIDELVNYSIGISALHPKTQREGIVLRPVEETYDQELGMRVSFKVINPEYLLTNKK